MFCYYLAGALRNIWFGIEYFYQSENAFQLAEWLSVTISVHKVGFLWDCQ